MSCWPKQGHQWLIGSTCSWAGSALGVCAGSSLSEYWLVSWGETQFQFEGFLWKDVIFCQLGIFDCMRLQICNCSFEDLLEMCEHAHPVSLSETPLSTSQPCSKSGELARGQQSWCQPSFSCFWSEKWEVFSQHHFPFSERAKGV